MSGGEISLRVLADLVPCEPYNVAIPHPRCVARWQRARSENATEEQRKSHCRKCQVGEMRKVDARQVERDSKDRTLGEGARGYVARLEAEIANVEKWMPSVAAALTKLARSAAPVTPIAPVEATVAEADVEELDAGDDDEPVDDIDGEELETSPKQESEGNEMARRVEEIKVCPGCKREMQRLTTEGVCRKCRADGAGAKKTKAKPGPKPKKRIAIVEGIDSVGPGPLTQYLDLHYKIEAVKQRHAAEITELEAAIADVVDNNPQLAGEAKAVLSRIAKG